MTLSELLSHRIMTGPALARKLGRDHSTIYRWAKGKLVVAAEDAIKIEAATAGKVKRHDLRPDLWTPPKKRAA